MSVSRLGQSNLLSNTPDTVADTSKAKAHVGVRKLWEESHIVSVVTFVGTIG